MPCPGGNGLTVGVTDRLLFDGCAMVMIVVLSSLVTHHGVGLTCSSLAIDEHCAVDALKRSQRNFSDSLLIDVSVGVPLTIDQVEVELVRLHSLLSSFASRVEWHDRI